MPDLPPLGSATCLDPEVLAAYADRALAPQERAQVEAHLAICQTATVLLADVMRTIDAMDDAVTATAADSSAATVPAAAPVLRPAFGRRWVWRTGGAALAAAAALVLVVQLQPEWWWKLTGGVDPRFAMLIDAIGTERTVEGRLSGGFPTGSSPRQRAGPRRQPTISRCSRPPASYASGRSAGGTARRCTRRAWQRF